MAEDRKFRAVRGVRDILPPDTSLWNWFEGAARDVLESYNFREIRLPVFEETELFARSVGSETDIVSKEMYALEDTDLPELAALRTLLVGMQPRIQDKRFFLSFELRAGELRERLRRALEERKLPPTPENERVINDLGPLLDHVAAARQRYQETQDPQALARFDLLMSHIREALLSIRLGDGLSLRPEATASVVRAYIEHGMQTWAGLVKLYYAGPMFRRERPQKGRYRQFYQIGAEVLGPSDHPAIDAEMIEMLIALVERCKLDEWTLLVNSIGDPQCRPAYVALLREELGKVKDKLGPDSQRRIDTNPLRVLDSKLPEEQGIIEALPRITDHLCEGCRTHFAELRHQLDLRSIPYRHEPRLVRGLDYYVRTTFEITSPHLGAQNALAGGGRYDGLAELLGGPPAKGIGFALGEDRFVEVIQAAGRIDATRPLDAFIVWMGDVAYPAALRLARRLRQDGLCVELPPEETKLKKALGLAERLGARFAVIIGENEMAEGRFAVKRLADGEQRSLPEAEVGGFMRAPAVAQQAESESAPR
jgi:histidyl-tRNA synthetase